MMTEADKRVARELIEFGCSARLVGRYLGYAHCTILANLVDRPPQKRYVKFTDAQIAEAERLRGKGLCWKAVAREIGVDDERSLQKACHYRGRLPGKRISAFTDAQIAEAERLRGKGLCWKAVAREIGVDDDAALRKACWSRGCLPVLPNRLGRAR